MALFLLLALPLASAFMLAFIGHKPFAHHVQAFLMLLLFMTTIPLLLRFLREGAFTSLGEQLYIDAFNVFLIVLTTFVALTTALFSQRYMRREVEGGKLPATRLRLYHPMFQIFIFTMLLALVSNNLGILWVAMEAATLSTVLLVSLYRTAAGFGAAWSYFILCSVGIAQALFGTILLYFAAEHVLGAGNAAMLWTHLFHIKSSLSPAIVSLAFVFLLVGYGTKAAFVPLHNWLPDAYAEGPTPVIILSGLLLNVAMYAILRSKLIVDGALQNHFAGHLMMGFGVLSVVVAAFSMLRQTNIKRLLAYSSIEHIGLMSFAFGLGGLGSMAGLLHMTAHTLAKSAAFFAVGEALQRSGTMPVSALLQKNPWLGWGLTLAMLVLIGLPPSGIFTSEFTLLTVTMTKVPWATLFVVLALGTSFAAILGKTQAAVFGASQRQGTTFSAPLVWIHLAIIFALGVYLPRPLLYCFNEITTILR